MSEKRIVIRLKECCHFVEIFLIEKDIETKVATISKNMFDDGISYEFYKSFCGSYKRE